MSTNSNARIAKNTILLYIRMLITIVISLYTSREILHILGEDDFGIYNVVGGVVVLFSFLTQAMTVSTQRFLNYNLGLNDKKKIADVFNTSMLTHITISGVVFVLAETIGLWFVMTQLNIPHDRYIASLWVYQASVLATLLNIIVIPYRSSIIATERMGIFAYISILDVILKLIIVLMLPYFSVDSLILYSILFAGISLLNFILYNMICKRKIWFTHFHFVWDKKQYLEQMSFSGWYLFGGLAMVGTKQGSNILINIFYNVAINAAVGIANQVRAAVYGFVTSFQTAFNPQIVKLYASGEHGQMLNLIFRSSKFSYYLLFILSLPVVVFCKDILSIWLVNVPEYTVVFTQLVVITSFTEALSAPLWTAIGATGNIKKYQFLVSLIILLDLPLVYVAFLLGYSPTSAFILNLMISLIAYIYRLLYIRKYVAYRLVDYFKIVLLPGIWVTILSLPIPIFLQQINTSLALTLVLIGITIIQACVIIYMIGLNQTERHFLINILKKKLIDNSMTIKKQIKKIINPWRGSVEYILNTIISHIPSRHLRLWILKVLGARIDSQVSMFCSVNVRNIKGLSVGRGSSIGPKVLLDARRGLKIGRNVTIAYEAIIWTLHHDYNSSDFRSYGSSVEIGDYAWICSRSIVLPGVKIGEGAVVACGAVVTKDVEPYTVVGGIPAKKIADRNRELKYMPYYNLHIV